jgi:hypothetical protein
VGTNDTVGETTGDSDYAIAQGESIELLARHGSYESTEVDGLRIPGNRGATA